MPEKELDNLSPSQRALLAIRELRSRLEAVERERTEPIAIIGMGCRFPGGSDTPEKYWEFLRRGQSGIREIPKDRWDMEKLYDPNPDAPGKIYIRHGGFLDRTDQFDPAFFRISPREAESLDPQQRLLLEVSYEALCHAGIDPKNLVRSQTGVFVGVGQSDYSRLQLNCGDLTRINAYSGTGNLFCFVSGRLAYTLGLNGPNLTLDTACSSSLVAIHIACQSLRSRECDMALTGGVHLVFSPEITVFLCRTHVLSPDGLSFQNRSHRVFDDLIHLYMERLKGMRFDAVAAAVQRVLEEVVVAYVRNWIRKTGIRKIALAGGSFMNVKLNMLISQLPEVENLFIMPSCSDESTCLGAALKVYADECRALGKQLQVEALMHLYYGPEYGERELLSALEKHAGEVCWKKSAKITDEVADVLVKNGIVARLAGRMEFGARALGNRSILANPSEMRNVSNINRAIKMRDYWMPFAPVILEERQHDYVINPRSWPAKYMINAFESTPLAQKELICGLHPADLTCRPQFVTREDNEGYYDIVKKFEAKTGIGGLLNTSFNLHGEPIVCTPEDGISTLLRSKIDYLAVSDYLVWRKDMPAPEEFVR